MKFSRSSSEPTVKDVPGKVCIKIILQDPGLQLGYPVSGNRKEWIVVDNATVGEVYAAIAAALFGDKQTSNQP
jgi:hypothetical protein